MEPPELEVRQDQQGELLNAPSGPKIRLDRLEAQLLDQAEASMSKGKVGDALQTVAQAISCCERHFSGRAYDIIGAALTHPNYRLDYDSAAKCLRRVEEASSMKGYGRDTGCWLITLSEMLTMETMNQRLRKTIRSQDQKIQTLKKQIEELKAVDLEPVQPESAVEVQ